MLDQTGSSLPTIAIISHAHPSISKGGAEIAAATLFRGLREIGAACVFIAAVPEASRRLLDLGPDEYPIFYESSQYDHFYHIAAPDVSRQLCRTLDKVGAEILNFQHFLNVGLGGLRDAAAMPGRITTFTFHEFLSICHHHGQMVKHPGFALCNSASAANCATCFPEPGRRRFDLRQRFLFEAYAGVKGFFSPSRFLADRYVSWGIPGGRMHVVENGLARPTREWRGPGRSGGKFVFGYFGQVNPFKGVDILLQAAELLAQNPAAAERIEIRIHGNVVGQSEAFCERLERLSRTLPVLKFLGPYDNGQVLSLMGDCDYVVVPSVWWENSPVVIQEAYAVGRPVICTGIGGMAEKVPHGVSGLHFRRGDPEDLVRAILTAADENLFAQLQVGIARPLEASEMAHRYLEVFQTLAAPEAAAVPDEVVGDEGVAALPTDTSERAPWPIRYFRRNASQPVAAAQPDKRAGVMTAC